MVDGDGTSRVGNATNEIVDANGKGGWGPHGETYDLHFFVINLMLRRERRRRILKKMMEFRNLLEADGCPNRM